MQRLARLVLAVTIAALLAVPLRGTSLRSATAAPAAVLFHEPFDRLDPAVWAITDSERRMATTHGQLFGLPRAAPGWNDPMIAARNGYERRAGRTLTGTVLTRDVFATYSPSLRWATDPTADPTADGHGFFGTPLTGGDSGLRGWTLNAVTPTGPVDTGIRLANVEYVYTIVQREQGAYYLVSSVAGGVFPAWPQARLVWADGAGSAPALTPVQSNRDATFQVDDLRVVDLDGPFAGPDGLAVVADRFEDGPGADWTLTGPWERSGGQLRAGPGGALALLPATADGLVEARLRLPVGGEAGIILGDSDARNYLFFRLANGEAQIGRLQDGTAQLLAQAAFPAQADTAYRLVVQTEGSLLRTFINGERVLPDVTADFGGEGLLAGVLADGAGAAFDDVAVWPLTVTLPAEAAAGVMGGGRGSDDVSSDEFPSSLGTNWRAMGGEWDVDAAQGNARRTAPGPTDKNVLLDTAVQSPNGEFAVDVLPPVGDPYAFAGIAFRAADLNNFFFARIFRVPTFYTYPYHEPTFEIELGQYVEGNSAITRYLPIAGEVFRGQPVRLRVVTNGPWITVYINGIPKIELYSTDLLGNTGAGLYTDRLDTDSRFDNWKAQSGGTLTGDVTVPPLTGLPVPALPPPPPPADAPLYVRYLGGEGAIDGADFRFSFGQRANSVQEGWLVHAPRNGGHFLSTHVIVVNVDGGAGSVWGRTTTPWTQAPQIFNLYITAQHYRFTIYAEDGGVSFRQEGPVTGGSITLASAPE